MKAIAIIFITVIVVLFAVAGCINLYKKKKYEKTAQVESLICAVS